jgi:hypothetical protein
LATEDVARKEAQNDESSDAQEQNVGDTNGAGASEEESSSALRRAVKAGALAAAAGTTVAAAAKVLGSRSADTGEGDEEKSGGAGSSRSSRIRGAAKRGEPLVSAGWDAAKGSVLPLVENGARAAGRFVAERSPDVVRDNILPPFIEAFTEARGRSSS